MASIYRGQLRILNKQCRTKSRVALWQGIVPESHPTRVSGENIGMQNVWWESRQFFLLRKTWLAILRGKAILNRNPTYIFSAMHNRSSIRNTAQTCRSGDRKGSSSYRKQSWLTTPLEAHTASLVARVNKERVLLMYLRLQSKYWGATYNNFESWSTKK